MRAAVRGNDVAAWYTFELDQVEGPQVPNCEGGGEAGETTNCCLAVLSLPPLIPG